MERAIFISSVNRETIGDFFLSQFQDQIHAHHETSIGYEAQSHSR